MLQPRTQCFVELEIRSAHAMGTGLRRAAIRQNGAAEDDASGEITRSIAAFPVLGQQIPNRIVFHQMASKGSVF